MENRFNVFDILEKSIKVMDYKTLCATYPKANLLLLKEGSISIVSIYDKGRKVAVINRLKEVDKDVQTNTNY